MWRILQAGRILFFSRLPGEPRVPAADPYIGFIERWAEWLKVLEEEMQCRALCRGCRPPRVPPTHSAVHHAHLPSHSSFGASTGDHDLLSRLQRRHAVFNSCAQVLRQRLRVTNYLNGPFNATKVVFHGGASP